MVFISINSSFTISILRTISNVIEGLLYFESRGNIITLPHRRGPLLLPSHNILPTTIASRTSPSSASSHSHRPPGRSPQPLSTHINRPLKLHVWTSHQQLWSRVDLDRERNAYFDTRVTGQQEIWQAIRVALEILWQGGDGQDTDGGLGTAQSILTAADVTIPTGDLAGGVYDSTGSYYPLPEHIVSDPSNIAEVPPRGSDGGDNSEDEQSEEEIKRRDEKGKGVMLELRARLSDNGGADVVVKIGKDESARLVTRRIFEASGHAPPKHIKLAYCGKLLTPYKSLVDQGWQEGHVVNAMVFG